MPAYYTPDVYVEEISTLPPSVTEVSTAIPAFLGYTATDAYAFIPKRLTSFLEFKSIYGGPADVSFSVDMDKTPAAAVAADDTMQAHTLYYLLDLFFKNGGGDCYIVSLGAYKAKSKDDFSNGLDALKGEDEPTLIILSEAATLTDPEDYYALCQEALQQCAALQDRFCIFDVLPPGATDTTGSKQGVDGFRNKIGNRNLNYGAAYYPYLYTTLNYLYSEDKVTITAAGAAPATSESVKTPAAAQPLAPRALKAERKDIKSGEVNFTFTEETGILTISATKSTTNEDIVKAWSTTAPDPLTSQFDLKLNDANELVLSQKANNASAAAAGTAGANTLSSIKNSNPILYNAAKQEMGKLRLVLPPAAAIAGVYAATDRTRGVWKAPANVSLNSVIGPVIKLSSNDQEKLNVDTSGLSINAIRSFTGKGTLVWGARTLDGSSNEWRYVPVRRLFIFIEESAKKASSFAVFEPNTSATWLKVKGMIESFLYGLWQQGALAGAAPKDAYYVNIGLKSTMTQQDILEGRMIVEIGIAAARPAEFIVLRFSHKLQEI